MRKSFVVPAPVLLFLTLLAAAPLFAQDDTMAVPDARQKAAAKTFVAKPKVAIAKPPVVAKAAPLVPLNEHDKALQMLDRFSFGPRP
jgi:hypothetical protein